MNAGAGVMDADLERQRDALRRSWHPIRMPGRNAVWNTISPWLAPSSIASAAFFARLRNTCTS